MRNRLKRRYMFRDTVSISGWLFADLWLALAMLFFVFNTVGPKPEPEPKPTPTPTQMSSPTSTPTLTPTATLTPTPTLTPTLTPMPTAAPGLEQKPLSERFAVNIDALIGEEGDAKEQARAEVRRQISDLFGQYSGARRAGIVLTFGASPSSLEASSLAKEVNALLAAELPDVFASAVRRDFIDLTGRGYVTIEVYFLSGGLLGR